MIDTTMRDEPATSSRRGRWIGSAITIVVSGFVFWTYHNQFWYAPDEGNYAHVAQRVLSGEVLHRDVQDAHMGYINFANAGWMWLFGESLLSLRYPLIAIGMFSAAVAYWLTSADNCCVGIAAGLIVATLSIVQFLNPTAHWYCFGLVWTIVACLAWWPQQARGRLFLVGFLVGLVFLFRQLTGVLVAMGVLAYLISEATGSSDNAEQRDRSHRFGTWSARLLCGIMFCGLLGYLRAKTDGLTLIMYGSWPLAVLAIVGWRTRITAGRLAEMLGLMAIGAIIATAPLVIYHGVHGSMSVWLADTVISAESVTRLDFFRQISFPLLLVTAWAELLSGGGIDCLLNAVFWIAALTAAPILGLCMLTAARRHAATPPQHTPLAVLALFYGIVSLHYQIPIYLFYSLSLTLIALLQVARTSPAWKNVSVVVGVSLAIIGLHYHAAQPLARGWDGILTGTRADNYVVSSNPRCGLVILPEEAAIYAELCSLIDEQCIEDDAILALPCHSEIYFLSGRRNPFRFFNSALELTGDADVQSVINRLEASPPQLVFYHPEDKYNTRESLAVIDWVRGTYERLPSIGEFEVYRHQPLSVALLE